MTPQEKLKTLLDFRDRNGKRLSYKPEEGGKIYLEIDGEVRCLGHIILGDHRIVYQKFEDESHIFRKTDAWSINHTVLSNVDDVWYESRTVDYHITKERAVEFGEYFHFQDTTELKIYVPLKYWEVRHKGMQAVFPEVFKWRNRVGDSWYNVLKDTLHSDLMTKISKFVKYEREVLKKVIYPESTRIFRAFKLCTFEHTKVVIIGQSPYHDGTADGLAFSYLHGTQATNWRGKVRPKSLDVIFQEVERDIYKGLNLDYDYELSGWARQGVLLLNAVLTAEKGKATSHDNHGWERFTALVLYKLLCDPTPKVFISWGTPAKELMDKALAVWNKYNTVPPVHKLLVAKHPAADLYNENKDVFGMVAPDFPRTFAGCQHFSQANEFLKLHSRKPIAW